MFGLKAFGFRGLGFKGFRVYKVCSGSRTARFRIHRCLDWDWGGARAHGERFSCPY